LAVSIASHSPLMQQASQHFNELISRIHLRPPQVPLISNITAQALTTVDDLRNELSEQLTRPVQWTRSVQEMVSSGVDTFVEIGPKQVLSGLIKRITPESRPITLSDAEVVKLLLATDA
jgi:[acyl-carrier-protein] S-malonyltransferase